MAGNHSQRVAIAGLAAAAVGLTAGAPASSAPRGAATTVSVGYLRSTNNIGRACTTALIRRVGPKRLALGLRMNITAKAPTRVRLTAFGLSVLPDPQDVYAAFQLGRRELPAPGAYRRTFRLHRGRNVLSVRRTLTAREHAADVVRGSLSQRYVDASTNAVRFRLDDLRPRGGAGDDFVNKVNREPMPVPQDFPLPSPRFIVDAVVLPDRGAAWSSYIPNRPVDPVTATTDGDVLIYRKRGRAAARVLAATGRTTAVADTVADPDTLKQFDSCGS